MSHSRALSAASRATRSNKATAPAGPTSPIDPAIQTALAALDLSAIRTRFDREHPDYADISERVELEYRKFVAIQLHHRDTHGLLFAAPPLISKFWRVHALHTRSYAKMCDVTGVRIPYDADLDDKDHPSYVRRLQNTIAQYVDHYGCLPGPDKPIWFIGRLNRGWCEQNQCVYWTPVYDPADSVDSQVWEASQMRRQVFIKSLRGKTITINLEREIRVGQLKQLISDKEDIPPVQQRLIHAGQQMEDFEFLEKKYGFGKEGTAHLVLRLRGC